MIRKIAGYSVIAVLGVLALKLLLWLVGVAFSLLVTLFWIALVGIVIYFVLRLFSPRTADRFRDTIRWEDESADERGAVAEDIEVEEEEEPEEGA